MKRTEAHNKAWPASLVTLSLLCLANAPAVAIDVTAGVRASAELKATVGVDDATREWIERLPTEVRVQLLKLLEQALPIIDEHVDEYLAKVNGLLDKQLDHMQCTMVGTTANVSYLFKREISILRKPKPMEEFVAQWEAKQTAFSDSTTPDRLMIVYEDFLVDSWVLGCQMAGIPSNVMRVDGVQAEVLSAWRVWARLKKGGCPNAHTCLELTRKKVRALIDAADPRDRAAIDAEKQWASMPPVPTKASFAAPRTWFEHFRQRPYENALSAAFAIEDGLALAQLARESRGRQLYMKALGLNQAASKALYDAKAQLSQTDWEANKRAVLKSADALRDSEVLPKLLKAAVAETSGLAPAAAELLAGFQSTERAVAALRETARENQKRIELLGFHP